MADFSQYIPLVMALMGAGLFAGLIAGLFGIGGGVVIVPVLAWTFSALGYGESAMHMAVGCSLATIIATSIRSAMAHNGKGAVDWDVVKGWVPWIMVGSVIGALLAGQMSGQGLSVFFGSILLLVAAQFMFGRPSWTLADQLPTGLPRVGFAGAFGAMSAIMGIGGGTFGVTLMTLCGHSVHRAVGTAATFGAAIGLPAAIGFAFTGLGIEGRPPVSIGYLNVPAILLIGFFTVAMAPIGASLAHKLDSIVLKRMFSFILFLTAVNMLYEGITG